MATVPEELKSAIRVQLTRLRLLRDSTEESIEKVVELAQRAGFTDADIDEAFTEGLSE